MLDEVLKMRSLLNEIEEPLEEFNDKLFHELVKGIEINKQDEMTVTFLGGLRFTRADIGASHEEDTLYTIRIHHAKRTNRH